MLSYILGLINAFEARHGQRPQLVYLNQHHLKQLLVECPWLNTTDDRPALGFRIVLISERELTQPRVVWMPSMPRYRIHPNARVANVCPANDDGADDDFPLCQLAHH
ncbi:MAG: hypothetical protein OEZ10_01505 [Gammaproteobacteria bacterium]|nr:hypothetical protein [Gammaproteobacteria bacterium]